jgi:hypothetical protein
MGRFWRRSHLWMLVGVTGGAAAIRHRPAAVLAIPYIRLAMDRRVPRERSLARAAVELPGRVAVDAAEIATMVRGSVRHRILFL